LNNIVVGVSIFKVFISFSLIGHHFHIIIAMELHNIFYFFLTFFFPPNIIILFIYKKCANNIVHHCLHSLCTKQGFQVPSFYSFVFRGSKGNYDCPYVVYKKHLGQSSNLVTIFFLCVGSGFRHPHVVNLLVTFARGGGNLSPLSSSSCVLKTREPKLFHFLFYLNEKFFPFFLCGWKIKLKAKL
jgi:hypothetical protein